MPRYYYPCTTTGIRTVQQTVYSLEEVKDKAIDKNWDINIDHRWWSGVYEDAERVGVKITGFDLDRRHDIAGAVPYPRGTAEKILQQHGDKCETYKLAEAFLSDYDNTIDSWPRDEDGEFIEEYDLDSKLEDLEGEFKGDLLIEYLSLLRQEYDYLTSEEAIIETLAANGYEYNEKGDII